MLVIGICDDESMIRSQIAQLCEHWAQSVDEEVKVHIFDSGEAILGYAANRTAETIDLLFLDIEMQGISGLETRDRLLRNTKVVQVVFVTSHSEQMSIAFGMKTVGFLNKPIKQEELTHFLQKTMEEKKMLNFFELPGTDGMRRLIRLECIYYFEAEGNYTTIYYYDDIKEKTVSEVLVMKIGKIEKMLAEQHFVRVHKSYLVNLLQVSSLTDKVSFLEINQMLTVGRKYKMVARDSFLEFVAWKVRGRL